jgi:hypothetical protein
MKASPDITRFHSFYLTILTSIITSQVHQTSTSELNIKTLFRVHKQRKENTIIYRQFAYHSEAHMWHHSAESLLAGDGSHSMVQLGGKVLGQGKAAINFQKTHLKIMPQARLSILILSKAYLTSGM